MLDVTCAPESHAYGGGMDIEKVLSIASSVSTPLGLGGLIAAAVFLVFRQIVQKNVVPSQAQAHATRVLTLIIERLFVLALVAMVLGFAGYLVPLVISRSGPESPTRPPPVQNPAPAQDTRTSGGTGAVYNGCDGEKTVEIYVCMGPNGENGGIRFSIPPGQTRRFAVEKGSTYRYNCDGPVGAQCPSPGAWVPLVVNN